MKEKDLTLLYKVFLGDLLERPRLLMKTVDVEISISLILTHRFLVQPVGGVTVEAQMFGQQGAPTWRLVLPGLGALDQCWREQRQNGVIRREHGNSVGVLGLVQDSCLNIAGPG